MLAIHPALTQAAPAPAVEGDVWTPSTLYFHTAGFQEAPINGQLPQFGFEFSTGLGLAPPTGTVTCIGDGTGQPVLEQAYNQWYGRSVPGWVRYNVTEDGHPALPYFRGFPFDVRLNGDKGILLHWYLETQVSRGNGDPVDPQVAPVVVPRVVVQATMRADGFYDDGPILGRGQSDAKNLVPVAGMTPGYFQSGDGHHVYEFEVPLEVQAGTIPKETGFTMRIDAFVAMPGCDPASDGKSLMPLLIRPHASIEALPRMEMEIADPIRFEYVHPMAADEGLLLHFGLNTAWGAYYLHPQTVYAPEIVTPAGERVALQILDRPSVAAWLNDSVSSHAFTFLWPGGELAKGNYTLSLRATDIQDHTSEVEFPMSVAFAGGEPAPKMPGLPAGLLLLFAALAVGVRRRAS